MWARLQTLTVLIINLMVGTVNGEWKLIVIYSQRRQILKKLIMFKLKISSANKANIMIFALNFIIFGI